MVLREVLTVAACSSTLSTYSSHPAYSYIGKRLRSHMIDILLRNLILSSPFRTEQDHHHPRPLLLTSREIPTTKLSKRRN